MNIINRGTWSAYTPDPYPADLPNGVAFAKSDIDGRDWYDAIYGATPLMAQGSVAVTALQQNGVWRTMAANVDHSRIFPIGQLLLEVTDYTGTDPQADLGGKVYDPVAGTIGPEPVNLIAYANQRQWAKVISGYPFTQNGTTYTISTSESSMALINGKFSRLSQPNAPTSISWQVGPTTFIDIPADDFKTLATNIADFVQATFDTLRNNVIPAIQAGTITTTAQIDAAFN